MPIPHMLVQTGFPQPMIPNIYPSPDIQYPNYPYTNSTTNYPMPGYSGSYPPYPPVSNIFFFYKYKC